MSDEYDFNFTRTPKRSRAVSRNINETVAPNVSRHETFDLSKLAFQSPILPRRQFVNNPLPYVNKQFFDCGGRNRINQKEDIVDLLNEFASSHLEKYGMCLKLIKYE
jgi:hypothetical protein